MASRARPCEAICDSVSRETVIDRSIVIRHATREARIEKNASAARPVRFT